MFKTLKIYLTQYKFEINEDSLIYKHFYQLQIPRQQKVIYPYVIWLSYFLLVILKYLHLK